MLRVKADTHPLIIAGSEPGQANCVRSVEISHSAPGVADESPQAHRFNLSRTNYSRKGIHADDLNDGWIRRIGGVEQEKLKRARGLSLSLS